MAGIFKRGDVWCACWKDANRQTVRRSTGVRIKEPGMSANAAQALAKQTAELMEQTAKGGTVCHRAIESLRATAVAYGAAASIPTVKEYLDNIPMTSAQKTDTSRKRAFTTFCDFIGGAVKLDMVTPEHCRNYIRACLAEVSRGTTDLRRAYLSHAFKRAMVEDNLLDRNPWQAVSVPKEAQSVNPDKGQDKQKRLPFTLSEIRQLIEKAPAPWCDIVATSYYAYGLRLSDVCLMRWDSINWAKQVITITEKKTRKERTLPMPEELAARLMKLRTTAQNEEYIYPTMAHYYNSGKASYASTQFTSLLRAMGIIPDTTGNITEGRRHNISPKSFHSIRHTVVSCLRGDASLSADIVRDAVGHDSEEIERGYFTATLEQRARVGAKLTAALNSAPEENSTYIA